MQGADLAPVKIAEIPACKRLLISLDTASVRSVVISFQRVFLFASQVVQNAKKLSTFGRMDGPSGVTGNILGTSLVSERL